MMHPMIPGDPSLTIIETGDACGLLLAESCDDHRGEFVLEHVVWRRRARVRRFFLLLFNRHRFFRQKLQRVALCRHRCGVFVARDTEAGCYFPTPSDPAYCVIFISRRQYADLVVELEKGAMENLLESVRRILKPVPGFMLDHQLLVAPPGYARRRGFELDGACLAAP